MEDLLSVLPNPTRDLNSLQKSATLRTIQQNKPLKVWP